MKSKIFLYILIAIAIVAILAFVIYQLVYRGNNNTTVGTGQVGSLPNVANQQFPSENQTSTVGTFNTSVAGGATASSSQFGVISNDQALDYFIDAANTAILVKPDGTIESIANGKTSDLSTTTISNIISVAFSYDGKKILVTMRNGTITLSSVLDLTTKSWLSLPNGIQSPVWSPTNYQIAYLAPSNSGTETLMTIDAGIINAKLTLITMLDMEDMGLQWPNKNTIIISDRPSAYTTGSIWLFNIPSRNIVFDHHTKTLESESLWNASDSALIFSAKSTNAGGQLVFQDATGAQKILSFMTLPSKCAFGTPAAASDTANPSAPIYCAVPSDQNTFSVARLPDEYDQYMYFTNDDFYSIDTDTGLLNKIFSSSTDKTNYRRHSI